MKKLLLIIVLLITLTLVGWSIKIGYNTYSNAYDNALDKIVYVTDGYEIKGFVGAYYEVCTSDGCYATDNVIYSNEYGDGIYLVLEKNDKNFFLHFMSYVFHSDTMYHTTLVIAHD